MSDVPAFVTDLIDKRSKAEARMKRAQATLAAATKDFEELDVALNVLTKHGYVPADANQPPPAITGSAQEPLNENYLLLLRHIPYSSVLAVAPKQVTADVHKAGRTDLSADYIRTALWRMAQRDILISEDGRYWRPVHHKSEEASDAETSEASDFTGLAGRGGSDSHPASESSSLSRSTPSQAAEPVPWDDDVPF